MLDLSHDMGSESKLAVYSDQPRTILLAYREMETAMPTDTRFMLDIHRQLVARNAVEVHAFIEITSDYQRCLDQLRDLRVRHFPVKVSLL